MSKKKIYHAASCGAQKRFVAACAALRGVCGYKWNWAVRRDDGDRGMRSRQFFKSTDVDERSHALVTHEVATHTMEFALDGHYELC